MNTYRNLTCRWCLRRPSGANCSRCKSVLPEITNITNHLHNTSTTYNAGVCLGKLKSTCTNGERNANTEKRRTTIAYYYYIFLLHNNHSISQQQYIHNDYSNHHNSSTAAISGCGTIRGELGSVYDLG